MGDRGYSTAVAILGETEQMNTQTNKHKLIAPRCAAALLAGLAFTLVSAPEANAQTTHTVQLDGIIFIPADITIEIGDTVRWLWISGIHNVESGIIVNFVGVPDGNVLSGDPTGTVGTTFEVIFDQAFLDAHSVPANTYPYYCVVHAGLGMAGTVAVVLRGDLDLNGVVDAADQIVFNACLSGPDDSAATPECLSGEATAADIDDDGDVDLRDYAEFQRALTQ